MEGDTDTEGLVEISEDGFDEDLQKKSNKSMEKVIACAVRIFTDYLKKHKPDKLAVLDVTEYSSLEELEALNAALKTFWGEARQVIYMSTLRLYLAST